MATKLREVALAACKAPTRYLSDPDVINSVEETAKVQAEWNAYFQAMRDIEEKYPYTEEEKARQPKPCCDSDD
jgi:hypothetical protein